MTLGDWRSQAACLGRDDLMFDLERVEEAVSLCRGCTVFAECSKMLDERGFMTGMVGVFAGRVYRHRARPRLDKEIARRLPKQRCPLCKEEFQLRNRRQVVCSSNCRVDLAAINELAATLEKILPPLPEARLQTSR